MNRDDIIRLAKDCELHRATGPFEDMLDHEWDNLHRFAQVISDTASGTELATLRAQLTASEASRKELRDALEKIRHGTNDDIPDRYRINAQDAYRIADAALANDAEQKGGA